MGQTGSARDLSQDPNRFALIADTHIMPEPSAIARGNNMTENLQQVVNAITQLDVLPGHVILNGDLATDGSPPTPAAYQQFGRLVHPLREAGRQLHLTMGNCDRRSLCAKTLAELCPQHPPVEGRLVDMLKTEHANWFFLDSLYNTDRTVTEGNLGEAQIHWLSKSLDQYAGRPAIVVAHHHLEMGTNVKLDRGSTISPDGSPVWDKNAGLLDNDAVVDVLQQRRHVKAYLCGHTHVWKLGETDGLHLINLPATGYRFDPEQPLGWVEGQLSADGLRLRLHAMDAGHRLNGQNIHLAWRKG